MPNIIANVLKIKNIRSLPLLVDKNGDVRICFNNILPIPEDLNPKILPKNEYTDYAIMYYITDHCTIPLRNLSAEDLQLLENTVGEVLGKACLPMAFYRTYDWSIKRNTYVTDRLYFLGKQYVKNYRNYGAATWYDWCYNNWNTKWDAFCCGVTENDPDALYFETAGMPAYSILKVLSQKYPEELMELIWADEMEKGEAGKAIFQHGEIQTKKEWTDNPRQKIIYNQCWSSKPPWLDEE